MTQDSGSRASVLNWLPRLLPLLSLIPIFGVVTGLLVFLGRLYLESYYSFFGIPPSSLDLDIQDYTFGAFPLVLFVLVVTAGVLFYWRAVPTGWLGSLPIKLIDGMFATYIALRPGRVADSLIFLRKPTLMRHETWRDYSRVDRFIFYLFHGLLYLLVAIVVYSLIFLFVMFFALIIMFFLIALALFSLSILGTGIGLGLLENLPLVSIAPDWGPWNIPGLRGLFSGVVLAAGTVVIIAILEWIVPAGNQSNESLDEEGQPAERGDRPETEREGDLVEKRQPGRPQTDIGRKVWVAPGILLVVIIGAMPLVTHFMARDQAIADFNTEMNRLESSLPVAVFNSSRLLGDGQLWSKECVPQIEGSDVCQSPKLKVVLINNGMAYVVLHGTETSEGLEVNLYTIALEEINKITYISPVGSFIQAKARESDQSSEN